MPSWFFYSKMWPFKVWNIENFNFKNLNIFIIRLRGVSYFVYAASGSKLNEKEKTHLVYPGFVVAVFEFGSDRYCKLCQEDGEWSRYQEKSNCNKINW
jgi:hypothetical protein